MLKTDTEMRKKLPEFLSEEDILALTSRGREGKEVVSVRLTAEARRILDAVCAKHNIKRGAALELILREIREIWKLRRG